MSRKIFIGKEAEGKLAGLDTLFVAGIYSYDEIKLHLKEHSVQQVYFGAGDPTGEVTLFNRKEVEKCIQDKEYQGIVTMECTCTDIADALFNVLFNINRRIEIIYTILTRRGNYSSLSPWLDTFFKDEFKDKVQIKVVTPSGIYLTPVSSFVYNTRDKYKEDKILERISNLHA